MKKLAFILSLIVVVLSIAPCCALEDHIAQVDVKTAFKLQNPPQDEDCCQDCSPFYTCGTCGGFMITPLVSFTTPPSLLIAPHFDPFYLHFFADDIDQNIWQPPKLS